MPKTHTPTESWDCCGREKHSTINMQPKLEPHRLLESWRKTPTPKKWNIDFWSTSFSFPSVCIAQTILCPRPIYFRNREFAAVEKNIASSIYTLNWCRTILSNPRELPLPQKMKYWLLKHIFQFPFRLHCPHHLMPKTHTFLESWARCGREKHSFINMHPKLASHQSFKP